MEHPIKKILADRRSGIPCGIPSYCSANMLVLEAAMLRAKKMKKPVLIEATANQVNQFGGYTGMKPADYYRTVMDLARKIGVPEEYLILAGDHLGPLTWQNEPETSAMEKSRELVYQYVRSGFTKIHLDTSMKLADDPEGALSTETVARRGVELYKVCMQAYEELKKEKPNAMRPVFVIGSEVPIPGGAQEEEDALAVTKPEAFRDTVETYKRMFAEYGVPEAWEDVIAVVVQPGVEFGDDQVFLYKRKNAALLCECLKDYPTIGYEGHSTDYQSEKCLRQMVEDGIYILKVGPALTYGLREALFALAMMEKEVVPEELHSNFIEVLEEVMQKDPSNWKKHYHGDERACHLARKYSFSDRARYYIGKPEVQKAQAIMFENLRNYELPMNMLHQYMPSQYMKVRNGRLDKDPRNLAIDGIYTFMREYEYACYRK